MPQALYLGVLVRSAGLRMSTVGKLQLIVLKSDLPSVIGDMSRLTSGDVTSNQVNITEKMFGTDVATLKGLRYQTS